MLFNSIDYLFFLFIVLIFHQFINSTFRLILLIAASNYFYYSFQPQYLYLIYLIALLDFFLAKYILKNKTYSFYLLLLNLFINLFILFYFKYINYIIEILSYFNAIIFNNSGDYTSIMLPLGISFYTFQSISYIVDVYRGKYLPQNKFLPYLCYIFFFPLLIAGPLVRANELIPQLEFLKGSNFENLVKGFKLIILGLLIKVVLADNLSPIVDEIYNMPTSYLGALDVLTMAFIFGFQIYFDFSSYSMIAIGSALLFGITLPQNFNFPYSSSSPKEFWTRWNITLSKWIFEYIYIPLKNIKFSFGLNTLLFSILPLFLTWFIMGLWHGSSINFILWGIYQALFIFIYRIVSTFSFFKNIKYINTLGCFITLPTIMLSWIFFRARDINQAFEIYTSLFKVENFFHLSFKENYYLITLIITIGYFVTYFWYKYKIEIYFPRLTFKIFTILFYTIALILVFTYLEPINQFIYFQF